MDSFERIDERFLREIGRVFEIAAHMATEGEDAIPVQIVDLPEGVRIALLASGDQREFDVHFQALTLRGGCWFCLF